MDHQFRSVAFGGFHNQDVLDFLEANSRDHAQQLQELQKRAEEQTKQLESAQADQKKYQAAQESLTQQEKKYAALHALFEYAQAIESGTDTEITSTSIKVEAQKDALDAEMRSYYEALKTAQQAG